MLGLQVMCQTHMTSSHSVVSTWVRHEDHTSGVNNTRDNILELSVERLKLVSV